MLRAILLVVCLAVQAPGRAAEPVDAELYAATAIVTGTDMRSRPAGFAQCLRTVLVKLTGEPALADDPRVAAFAAHANFYVVRFGYVDPLAKQKPHDDQGTYDRSYDLTVAFDPAKIASLLQSVGVEPWTGVRPVLRPVIAMRGEARPWTGSFTLTADGQAGSVQRASLLQIAARYGMTVRLPGQDDTPTTIHDPDDMLVVASFDYRPEAFGWVGSWTIDWRGRSFRSSVSGVGFDAAFERMVASAVRLASGRAAPD